jgi:DNA-binding response OmpR family regulator
MGNSVRNIGPEPAGPTVLVIDDDPAIVELVRDFLQADGFGVITAESGDLGLDLAQRQSVDCVVLDVMMPGMSGYEFCRLLRERRDVPILFLSARSTETDKIRGLMLGGDDYIVKDTATPSEIVARVKAVLRRYTSGRPQQRAIYDFGRFTLDPLAHEVCVEGTPIPFAAREFEILQFLVEHPRQVFTQEHLFDHFWQGVGDHHAVAVYINRIRQKIEPDLAAPQFIVTVWGVGYRFEGVHS